VLLSVCWQPDWTSPSQSFSHRPHGGGVLCFCRLLAATWAISLWPVCVCRTSGYIYWAGTFLICLWSFWGVSAVLLMFLIRICFSLGWYITTYACLPQLLVLLLSWDVLAMLLAFLLRLYFDLGCSFASCDCLPHLLVPLLDCDVPGLFLELLGCSCCVLCISGPSAAPAVVGTWSSIATSAATPPHFLLTNIGWGSQWLLVLCDIYVLVWFSYWCCKLLILMILSHITPPPGVWRNVGRGAKSLNLGCLAGFVLSCCSWLSHTSCYLLVHCWTFLRRPALFCRKVYIIEVTMAAAQKITNE